jgi:hypothetical protein
VGETRQGKRIIFGILSLCILLSESNNVHIHNELATCITVPLSSALESIPQPIDSATLSRTRPPPASPTLALALALAFALASLPRAYSLSVGEGAGQAPRQGKTAWRDKAREGDRSARDMLRIVYCKNAREHYIPVNTWASVFLFHRPVNAVWRCSLLRTDASSFKRASSVIRVLC